MTERVRFPDAWAAIEHFFRQEWSDGLPVVPPTEALVGEMLALIVLLCPEHAAEIARAGYSRQDVRQYIFDHARLPVRELEGRGYDAPGCWPDWIDANDPDALVPIVAHPDRILLAVAGGDGRHSAWMPAWNVCRGATERIVVR